MAIDVSQSTAAIASGNPMKYFAQNMLFTAFYNKNKDAKLSKMPSAYPPYFSPCNQHRAEQVSTWFARMILPVEGNAQLQYREFQLTADSGFMIYRPGVFRKELGWDKQIVSMMSDNSVMNATKNFERGLDKVPTDQPDEVLELINAATDNSNDNDDDDYRDDTYGKKSDKTGDDESDNDDSDSGDNTGDDRDSVDSDN